MLTREFAHEIAKEVFAMLEQKWDARRAAAIARKEQEEIERAAKKVTLSQSSASIPAIPLGWPEPNGAIGF